MKDTDSMTMQDVLEMMKCIREFFTVVRLESGYDTMDSEETYCEIEYLKEDIFFVKAKRIEIDGKPYVVKIKQEVDDKILQALLESDQIPLCLLGHFHQPASIRGIRVLPAWQPDGEIGIYDPATEHFTIHPWKQILNVE